jgi:hypothetical protein
MIEMQDGSNCTNITCNGVEIFYICPSELHLWVPAPVLNLMGQNNNAVPFVLITKFLKRNLFKFLKINLFKKKSIPLSWLIFFSIINKFRLKKEERAKKLPTVPISTLGFTEKIMECIKESKIKQ